MSGTLDSLRENVSGLPDVYRELLNTFSLSLPHRDSGKGWWPSPEKHPEMEPGRGLELLCSSLPSVWILPSPVFEANTPPWQVSGFPGPESE